MLRDSPPDLAVLLVLFARSVSSRRLTQHSRKELSSQLASIKVGEHREGGATRAPWYSTKIEPLKRPFWRRISHLLATPAGGKIEASENDLSRFIPMLK